MPRKAIAAVWALTALVFWREPVLAQTTEPVTISLEAEIGLDGWVELSEPVPLRVTITSELLFSGTLELRHGRSEVTTAVEVPAGGEKTYELLISPTMATRALNVELVPSEGDGSNVASVRVEPKDPQGQLLVGTLGFPGELDLPRETLVASVPIVEVRLLETDTDLAPLDYLVVAGGTRVPEAVLQWVADGGRLLVQPGAAAELASSLGIMDQRRSGVYRLGDGQVLEQGRSTPTSEEWASVIVPFRDEHHLSDFWGSSEVQMIRAASQSAKAWLPYSGALVGLVVYAIVVAPVNLIVLRRMRRRELAWITVPAISLAAVVAFVAIGSLQDNSTDWGQATIVVSHGGGSESISVIAASANGPLTQTLSTGEGSFIYPAATADAVGVGGRAAIRHVVSSQQLDLIFGGAGYGTAAVAGPTPTMPVVEVVGGGVSPSIRVQNLSPYDFQAYGVVTGVSVGVGPGRLGAGNDASFVSNGQICPVCSAAEAVVQQTGLWNDTRWWQIYEPLTSAARELVGDQYFFGFVENLPLQLQVNGEDRTINGPGMLVMGLDGLDLGQASPEIVGIGPDSTIQGEGAWRWLTGEWALMEFTVPLDREIALHHQADMFGPAPSIYEVWDWGSESFVSIEPGEIDHLRFVNPDGAVLLRVNLGAADDQFFSEFPIGSISITWDTETG